MTGQPKEGARAGPTDTALESDRRRLPLGDKVSVDFVRRFRLSDDQHYAELAPYYGRNCENLHLA